MTAELIEVIRTTLTRRGAGETNDPIRQVTQYWSLDGELLAEDDHWERTRALSLELARQHARPEAS